MHGSSEGHTGYLYRRSSATTSKDESLCDPLFKEARRVVETGYECVVDKVDSSLNQIHGTRSRRSLRVALSVEPDSEAEE